MYVSFSDFARRLSINLPGSTEAAVRAAFNDTARTFYRRTRAWKETLGGFDLPAGTTQIPLHPIDQICTIVYLDRVWSGGGGGGVGTRVNEFTFHLPWLHSNIYIEGGTVLAFAQPLARPCPDLLFLRCSVQPRPGADQFPEAALTHHYEGLVSGTLAMMMATPAKPYTDLRMAEYHGRRFETEIARATTMLKTGYGQHQVPWRYNTVPSR